MTKILKKIYSMFFYRLNLKQKLFFSYFVLIIFPLVILTYFSYKNMSSTLVNQFQYSSDQSLVQTNIYLNKVMSEIIDSTDQIAFNETLSEFIRNQDADGTVVQAYTNYLKASNLTKSYFTSDILYSVELFIHGDSLYVSKESKGQKGISFICLDSSDGIMFNKLLSSNAGKLLFLAPRDIVSSFDNSRHTVITCARYIKDTTDYHNLGILSVNLKQNSLTSTLLRANILPGSISMLLSEDGTLLAASNHALIDSYAISVDSIYDSVLSGKDSIVSDNKGRLLLNSRRISETGWTLVSLIPYQEMLATSLSVRNHTIFFTFIISILFLITAYFISNSMTGRISLLSKRMQQLSFNKRISGTFVETDEVSILTNNFDNMVKQIDDYAASQYQLGIDLKNMELQALQAQINPHFLYNTLDLINWLAISHNADEISELVQLLSQFYKLSLSKGVEVVSIQNALLHIETYIKIQNFRFNDSIQLVCDIDPAILPCGILKLLLQPIVENSILHGIFEKETQQGTITILGKTYGSVISIQIIDDGIGMTPEQIDAVKNSTHTSTGSSYGIKNVIERIRLYYGAEYGLTYDSSPDKGTTVTVKIPHVPLSE